MLLAIIALLMFLAMVAAWVMLPGSMIATPKEEIAEPMPVNAASQTA